MINKIAISLGVMLCSSSCVSNWLFSQDAVTDKKIDSSESESKVSELKVSDSNVDSDSGLLTGVGSSDLKMARLWNKVQSLEDEVRLNKERIRLLETGMTTGLSHKSRPDMGASVGEDSPDLQRARKSLTKPANTRSKIDAIETPASASNKEFAGELVNTNLTKKNGSHDQYKVRIQLAKEYYQASRFGLAVAEFSKVENEFGDAAGDGEAKIYLGKSYLALKEFGYAKEEFEEYLTKFPGSEREAEVRLDLSRVYLGLNLRERARAELGAIAAKYKGTEAGGIALREMEKMKGTL